MNYLAEVNDYICICNLGCLRNLNLSENNITVLIAGKQTNKQIYISVFINTYLATVEAPSNLPGGMECIHVPIDDKHTMDIAQYFDIVNDAICEQIISFLLLFTILFSTS